MLVVRQSTIYPLSQESGSVALTGSHGGESTGVKERHWQRRGQNPAKSRSERFDSENDGEKSGQGATVMGRICPFTTTGALAARVWTHPW